MELIKKGQTSYLKEIVNSLKLISLDTETTGLDINRDKLFSIIIGTASKSYYLNFNPVGSLPDTVLDKKEIAGLLTGFSGTIFLHNAKFDMHMLLKENLDLCQDNFTIHDTGAIARLVYNDHIKYSLEYLCEKLNIGANKSDAVIKYCMQNKLWEWQFNFETGKRTKKFFFDRVPLSIMFDYGCGDAKATYRLGISQLIEIKNQSEQLKQLGSSVDPINLLIQERQLTKVLFKMECEGMPINEQFIREGLNHNIAQYEEYKKLFTEITGMEFNDGPKTLSAAFDKLGLSYPLTEKGNPSFNDAVLKDLPGELGHVIREYRHYYKLAHTYFENYLTKQFNGKIHTQLRQGGTLSGRMSSANPNLQNCKKVEKDDPGYIQKYLVRRCFVPDPGNWLMCFDYDQMEYRLMLDYAGEMELIEQVKSGICVHTATGNLMGVTRREAKTINFMLLYGGGLVVLAMKLYPTTLTEVVYKEVAANYWDGRNAGVIATLMGIPLNVIQEHLYFLEEAKKKRGLYFKKLPRVKDFISDVVGRAEQRGYIFNWLGRKLHYTQKNAYSAPNGLIQGGCADIVKRAMIQIDHLLHGKKTKMILQVHDELVFNFCRSEIYLLPEIKKLMENAYPYRYLPLTVSIEKSNISWQDKEEFFI